MGTALSRLPEQPVQPPELPWAIERSYEWVTRRVYDLEKRTALHRIPQILESGQGLLDSCSPEGYSRSYDAGDLWQALTENDEHAELAPLAGALLLQSAEALAHAKKFLAAKVEQFAEDHAQNMADQAGREHVRAGGRS